MTVMNMISMLVMVALAVGLGLAYQRLRRTVNDADGVVGLVDAADDVPYDSLGGRMNPDVLVDGSPSTVLELGDAECRSCSNDIRMGAI